MSRHAAVYVGGIGFSKFALLLTGALTAQIAGPLAYAQFVLFLTFGNVLINLCSMGIIPRILALPESEGQEMQLLMRGALASLLMALLIAAFVTFATQPHNPQGLLFFLSTSFYFAGNYLLLLVSAQHNRRHQHHIAGWLWVAAGTVTMAGCGVVLLLAGYPAGMLTFALLWALFGLCCFFMLRERGTPLESTARILSMSTAFAMFRSMYSGLFGLPFLFIFYAIAQEIIASESLALKAAYMLGLQLFTITTFLPGVLGAVFLPALSQTAPEHQHTLVKKLTLAYCGIGLLLLGGTWLGMQYLFSLYHIPFTSETETVIVLWQLSSVVAAVGAVQNQILVVRKAYGFLLAGSLIWGGVALSAASLTGFSAQGASLAILLAYVSLQGLYWWHYNRSQKRVSSSAETHAPRVFMLANPYSPHVRHWRALLDKLGAEVRVFTAHESTEGPASSRESDSVFPLGRLRKLPIYARYVALGLWARFTPRIPRGTLLHAHNTSGYGLSAFLSGRPYIITTYGSEIFDAQNRGKLYRLLLRRILRGARAVTSASPAMTEALTRNFALPKSIVHEFSLGVSENFVYSEAARLGTRATLGIKDSPVWMVNRRIHPHYHTLEVVKAFLAFRKAHGCGHLVLAAGDADRQYLQKVEQLCAELPEVQLIKGFLSQTELAKLLCAADFCISVPGTDQLSSSILEGAACGAYPVLAKLASYAPVSDFSYQFTISDFRDSRAFEPLFFVSYEKMTTKDYERDRLSLFDAVKKFRFESVLPKICALYEGLFKDYPVAAAQMHLNNDRPFSTD
ncbi:hypothetical protein Lgee_0124 [Legionella geestiana]|uniref:Glycosyltransferase subfamily 4-like N-terminal domain-containing protein n=1 Tax=Legionella geestiana TaxID=45065 RepID=A0A0W0U978_9GAMM|nr:glycosyltransferase [Legionella geestiana]KTD04514.1 hypothetical protein Lgee_0124 [Legionella geestiana]QBS12283.1 hypothetical protein E4T54_05710 [Legionella geestiana]STX52982.1 glycosyltransferase, MSMEG_0565 family [Legionella geestiana]